MNAALMVQIRVDTHNLLARMRLCRRDYRFCKEARSGSRGVAASRHRVSRFFFFFCSFV